MNFSKHVREFKLVFSRWNELLRAAKSQPIECRSHHVASAQNRLENDNQLTKLTGDARI